MKNCVLNLCNGSGLLSLKDGDFVPCGCRRYVRADEIFSISSAPATYKTFIQDLPFDPLVQNIRRKERNEELLKKGEISEDQYNEERKREYAPIKTMLAQYDDGRNNKPIRDFIQKGYKLYFYGDTGTAKTGSAVALAYEAGKRNINFYYISLHNIHKLFHYNFNSAFEVEQVAEAKSRIESADFLVIDDIGKEVDGLNLSYESDKKLLKKIHSYLDSVLRQKKRFIIFTSNTKIEEAKKLYENLDPRLCSMMFDGNVIPYHFREKIRKQEKDVLLDELL